MLMEFKKFDRRGTSFSSGYHTLEERILPSGKRAVVLVFNKYKKVVVR